MPKLFRIILPLAILLFLSSCSFSLAADITPPPGAEQAVVPATTQVALTGPLYPIVPPDPLTGAVIYAENCAACHGETGRGDGADATQLPVPVAAIGTSAVARQTTPAEWYALITQGNLERFMPPFQNLSDRQRWDVVAYVFSLSAPAESVGLGQDLYRVNCAQCHGASGQGNGPEAATQAAPPRDLSDQAFMAEYPAAAMYDIISQGTDTGMPAYTGQLSETEIWSLTDYVRSFTFAAAPIAVTEAGVETVYPPPEAYPYPIPAGSQPGATPTLSGVGTVVVQLSNGSGGDAPSDVPVTLYGFDSMQMAFTQTLTVGENGVYTFENIEMAPERAFLAGVDYDGGTYGSDVATVDPASPVITLPIVVYDSSTDTSVLTTDRLHIVFDFSDPAMVQVMEFYIISNPTNLAIIPAETGGAVVFFPLPEGYTDLQLDSALGERYLETPGGFVDTVTVLPGLSQYQVVFAFSMPYNRRLDFSQAVAMDISAVVVMLPGNGVNLSSSLLQDGGVRDVQGTSYRIYNGSNLINGSDLTFIMTGRPRQDGASPLAQTSWKSIAIGLGSLGLVLVLVGLWQYRRNKKVTLLVGEAGGLPEPDPAEEVDDPASLMDAIIALDDQYQAGDLPEIAYQQRRAELKQRLQKTSPAGEDR
jgi:mono/diheme cytochrome c family protein